MTTTLQDPELTVGDRLASMELLDLIVGKWVAQAISVAARLGIADLLAEGPRSTDDLARASKSDPAALFRLLRALAGVGVFAEVAPRRFALTPKAEPLRSGVPGSVRGIATYTGEPAFWRPWGHLLWSVETGKPAFHQLYGKTVFEHFAGRPEEGVAFDRGMSDWSNRTTPALLEAYDFSGFGTIVDVGGGHGAMLAAILEATPGPRGVVFDLPHVVEGAAREIEARGLAPRCRAGGGDFFDAVPPGADAYLLRHIIHSWDDDRASTILRSCRRAIEPGGRLLLLENVVGPANEPSYGKWLDLAMLVMAGGRERTEPEYASLLAVSGFRLTRVVPTASPLSVIEAEPV